METKQFIIDFLDTKFNQTGSWYNLACAFVKEFGYLTDDNHKLLSDTIKDMIETNELEEVEPRLYKLL